MIYVLLLALALSVDTFVLSISIGLSQQSNTCFNPFKSCFIFGFIQMGLFVVGRIISTFINFSTHNQFDFKLHISSLVFAFLAIKMLLEFFTEDASSDSINSEQLWVIATLTSIDALIIGITPLPVSASSLLISLAIFMFTAIAAFSGIEIARNLKKVEIIERYSLLVGAGLLLSLAFISF